MKSIRLSLLLYFLALLSKSLLKVGAGRDASNRIRLITASPFNYDLTSTIRIRCFGYANPLSIRHVVLAFL